MQKDMGVFESAKFHLAGSWAVDLDVTILKVAVVKLDVTRRGLGEKKENTQ